MELDTLSPFEENRTHKLRLIFATLLDTGIIWGDAEARNFFIDRNNDAWIIDFGGTYTKDWVSKDRMETLEGGQEGLTNIKALPYPTEVLPKERGMEKDEETQRNWS